MLKKSMNPTLFLLLLPLLFFFLRCLNLYDEFLYTSDILKLFIVYEISYVIFFFFLYKILNIDKQLSLLTATLIISAFLFFGLIQDTILTYTGAFLSNSLFIIFWLSTFTYFIIRHFKKNRLQLKKFNRFLLIMFSFLITYELILFSIKNLTGNTISALKKQVVHKTKIPHEKEDKNSDRPDIYYFIFDSYTNSETLKKYWGFNNDLVPFLDSSGFFVADSSFSNYISTPFSLTSIFNLQYLNCDKSFLVSNSYNFLLGTKFFKTNTVFDFLEKLNYSISTYSQLSNPESLYGYGLGVERPVNWIRKLTLERLYLNPWLLNKMSGVFQHEKSMPKDHLITLKKYREYNQEALKFTSNVCKKQVPTNAPPRFFYIHFMLPHDPYQFDENGNIIDSLKNIGGIDPDGYLKQIKYSNKIIREITNCLLRDKNRKKIIIIQGDHGYRHFKNAPAFDQFTALNAIYFYNGNYKLIPKKFSHVNTFSVVFNTFFNTKLSLNKDSIFTQ